MAPIIQPDAMRRLMAGGVQLKKVEIRVARPTNPDMFDAEDFSAEILNILARGGGDSLALEASIDGRLTPDRQHDLAARWKGAIRKLVRSGAAKRAKVQVLDDDGMEYPIDLLADRLQATVEIDHDGRYAPTASMLGALQSAWGEIEEQVEETLGNEGNALR